MAELRNTPEDVQVLRDPAGGLAVTVIRSAGSTKDGGAFDSLMRETLVWAEHGGTWRVVHEHTSPLPSGESA